MKEPKSIKKNILMSAILTASNFVFPLITFSYVARVLTPIGIGKVAFVEALLSYFSYIAILGIPAYGLIQIAKNRGNKEKLAQTVQELLSINLISTFFAYLFLFATLLIVPKFTEYTNLVIIMSSSILLNTIGLEWVYKGLEEYTYITIRSLIVKCIALVLTFLLIKNLNDYPWYAFVAVFTTSAGYLLNFLGIKKFISFKKYAKYDLKKHIKPILTLFSASIIITIYAHFDISMLGFISTETEVGLYSAASKIRNIVFSVALIVTPVLIPRMTSYIQQKNLEKAKIFVATSLRISLVTALPLAIYVFINAENVIYLVCGESFALAENVLKVLMLCIIPAILSNLFGNQILIPMGLYKRYSQSVFIGLFINIFFNIILIPLMGATGAALATVITEVWNVFWMSNGVKEYRRYLLKNIKFYKFGLALVIGVLVNIEILKLLPEINVFWQLMFTAIAYFIMFYGILILLKEKLISQELNTFISQVRKIKKKTSE